MNNKFSFLIVDNILVVSRLNTSISNMIPVHIQHSNLKNVWSWRGCLSVGSKDSLKDAD